MQLITLFKSKVLQSKQNSMRSLIGLSLSLSLSLSLQFFLPSNAYSSEISKQEYCTVFKQLAFPFNDTVFSRWESERIKVLLVGEPENLAYAKELLTKFSALTGKEIIYTDKNINVALVFKEDLYR